MRQEFRQEEKPRLFKEESQKNIKYIFREIKRKNWGHGQ